MIEARSPFASEAVLDNIGEPLDGAATIAAPFVCEVTHQHCAQVSLRQALLAEQARSIERLEMLRRECDHRLLNALQMVVGVLGLQSRAATAPEVASQFSAAAERVAIIGKIHQRLHCAEGLNMVAFRPFLEDFCRDFATMWSRTDRPALAISIEIQDIDLASETALPLGFIVNELVTNAAKYGKDSIRVSLLPATGEGYALTVSNDGRFVNDRPSRVAGHGLGMGIIRSFVEQIGGQLQRANEMGETRFTVLFSPRTQEVRIN